MFFELWNHLNECGFDMQFIKTTSSFCITRWDDRDTAETTRENSVNGVPLVSRLIMSGWYVVYQRLKNG